MEKFFYPKSVAVIGISENPANLAKGIVANMLEAGYQGKIYPVGPRGGAIFGLPILTHIRDLPEPADLAAVLTPARFVPQVVADLGAKGIDQVVVESGGFSELGEQGKALEEEITGLIKRYGIRLVGPNGIGTMSMEIGLSLPFSQDHADQMVERLANPVCDLSSHEDADESEDESPEDKLAPQAPERL